MIACTHKCKKGFHTPITDVLLESFLESPLTERLCAFSTFKHKKRIGDLNFLEFSRDPKVFLNRLWSFMDNFKKWCIRRLLVKLRFMQTKFLNAYLLWDFFIFINWHHVCVRSSRAICYHFFLDQQYSTSYAHSTIGNNYTQEPRYKNKYILRVNKWTECNLLRG